MENQCEIFFLGGDKRLNLPICKVKFGEGHGHPLLYSGLEDPMDREAWWAAIHRVAESRTRLKRLSKVDFSLLRPASFIYTHEFEIL